MDSMTDEQAEQISDDIRRLRIKKLRESATSTLKKVDPVEAWKRSLCSVSFTEIYNLAPDAPEFVLPPLIGKGRLALFTGRQKLGKTRFILSFLKAATSSTPYLGIPQRPIKALYLSEMDKGLMSDYLKRYSFVADDCKFSYFADVPNLSWHERVEAITAEAQASGIELIIFDTLFRWAAVSDDVINDYGAMNRIMEPLIKAKRSGISFLLTHHDRKAGGDFVNNALGSVAISGSVDDVIAMTSGGKNLDRYVLKAQGRSIGKPIEIALKDDPDSIFISFQPTLTEAIEERTGTTAQEAILGALASLGGATMQPLAEALEKARTPYSRSTILRELKKLKSSGLVNASNDYHPRYSLPS